jgi:hypothetical protein
MKRQVIVVCDYMKASQAAPSLPTFVCQLIYHCFRQSTSECAWVRPICVHMQTWLKIEAAASVKCCMTSSMAFCTAPKSFLK